ncbi:MAG: TerC family protein [Calditrichaeota bacterium]|nr:MAG: TerC family protein [Calditrichota bacterium]
MFEWLTDPQAWIALATLTALEIVLGVDNIVFISILVGHLPAEQRSRGRIIGLLLALVTRILLLLSITWIMRLTTPLFQIATQEFSGRDIILIIGGLFLIAKSTHEIHANLEGETPQEHQRDKKAFWSVVLQIAVLDIIFSLDSVITAVGLAKDLPVMILAIVLAMIVMIFSARALGDFVENHPTIKMLALSFLILIGVALLGEGFELHIPRGYIYFAMIYAVCVELLNMRARKKQERPVHLKQSIHLPS